MAVTVELTGSEYIQAMMVGCMRMAQNRRDGRSHAHGASASEAEQMHIIGAVGEACVAKYLNTFWLGTGKFRGPDVGTIQVRSRSKAHYQLILHEGDADDDIFVSVFVSEGVGELRGWLRGFEGKQSRYWSDPAGSRPAYFVPNDALHPMGSLLASLRGEAA